MTGGRAFAWSVALATAILAICAGLVWAITTWPEVAYVATGFVGFIALVAVCYAAVRTWTDE